MANLGIKTFWKSTDLTSTTQDSNQILKNDCYINIKLQSANYFAKGNFWQNAFGGSDDIALTTSLTYKNGNETIEATSILNRKEVKIKQGSNLATDRIVGEKIPSIADSISMEFKMIALKNDRLQQKFDLFNKPEYQAALQLTPKAVGQVLTITSLVKSLLSDTNPQYQINASFSGIISQLKEAAPVKSGKLTKGMLIFINTDDGAPFNNIDETKLELRSGSTLYYNNKEVENTYAVFIVSTDEVRGADQSSNWFKKYSVALRNLDKIRLFPEEMDNIYKESQKIWDEGNSLLEADINYLEKERIQISNAIIADIDKKFKELTQKNQPIPASIINDIMIGLTGSTAFNQIFESLPATGSFLNKQVSDFDPNKPIENDVLAKLSINSDDLSLFINSDKIQYVNILEANKIKWNFGE
jgi:hypothetical protein